MTSDSTHRSSSESQERGNQTAGRGPIGVTLHLLRQLKHAQWVARKRSKRFLVRQVWIPTQDALVPVARRFIPYRYPVQGYPGTFLGPRTPQDEPSVVADPPPVIWVLWTGDNPMTENRRRGLRSIQEHNPDLEVRLVTRDSLERWLVPGQPLHPAYPHLSDVHKSDYLRCYLMHFHGGGYCDVKPIKQSWRPAWERLVRDPHAWALGFRELSTGTCAQLRGRLGLDVLWNYHHLIGTSAFILRPGTPFTNQWWDELNRRLTQRQEALASNPGDARGSNPGYPVKWRWLLGDIFHPLQLKHLDHVRIDNSISPDFTDYQ